MVSWLFWVKRPFETVFQSISGRLPKRGRKRRERIDESKNVQTTPTRTYWKRNRPLPYCNQNCRTPRHWKFTQDHRTTRPTPRPFETVFQSISSRLPKRGRKRRERIEESKNVQTIPTRTYYERSRPLPYCTQIVGRPGTGSLPSTIAPPDHPRHPSNLKVKLFQNPYSRF